MKKWLSIVLTLIMVISIIPFSSVSTEAAGLTLSQLKAKFPAGKYWNHVGSSSNNQNGYTDTPCSSHGSTSTCNAFTYNGATIGWQCFGFALKLGYDAFGSNPKSWGRAYNLNSIKPGDIINYDGSNPGHTVFVTGVNGDVVSFAECNYGGNCLIRWDRSLKKSQFNDLYNVYVAPSALSGSDDTCSCSTSYSGEYTTKDVNSSLTIRSGHGTSYSVLGSIPANAKFTVSKADGSWAHISYNGTSGFVSCTYIQRVATNQRDTRYPSFKAYCISDEKVPAYDSVNGSSVGYIYGNSDFCEVLEVYTNGWAKVNCPWTGYTDGRIVYVPFSEFVSNTSYTPKSATAVNKTSAYFIYNGTSSPGYVYVGDTCTIIDERGSQYCVICPWSTSSGYNGHYMVWCDKSAFTHSHSYGSWSNYDSSYHARYCSCGNVEKASHSWNSGEITTYPGCESTGIKSFSCTVCGATKTQSISATGHSYDSGTITTEPTCTETGIKTYSCTNCNSTKTEIIDKIEHSYNQKNTSSEYLKTVATCDSPAIYYYSCSCGQKGTETFESGTATFHVYGTWQYENEHPHEIYRVCSSCGKKTYSGEYQNVSGCELCNPINSATIKTESKTVHAGEEFTVDVNIENNPGFCYLKLRLNYDSDSFEFIEAVNGTVSTDSFSSTTEALLWDSDKNATSDGTLVTLKFKAKDNLAAGEYTLGIAFVEGYNYNEENIKLGVNNATITVVEFIYGDVTGDNVINGKDLVRLRKYLLTLDETTGKADVEISLGADTTGDGVVNGKDLVRLRKYLLNYDEETGTSPIVLGPAT